MAMVLTEHGMLFEREPRIEVRFRGSLVGTLRPDFLVENALLVELKASRTIEPWHEAQTLKYLRATSIEVGLLLNFGPKPTFKRFILTNDRKH
jgi:GxxExxY protein